jgi:hypothetical protein
MKMWRGKGSEEHVGDEEGAGGGMRQNGGRVRKGVVLGSHVGRGAAGRQEQQCSRKDCCSCLTSFPCACI